MSAPAVLARVRRVRAQLAAALLLRALVVGVASALVVLVALGLADLVSPLGVGSRSIGRVLAAVAAVIAAATTLWRARRAASIPAVALWLEERVPALEYTLVTALESDGERAAALARRGASVDASGIVPRAALRAMRAPAVALLASVLLLAALPAGTRARVRAPKPGDALLRPGTPRSRLTPLVAQVAAPRYAGGETRTIDEPTTIAALAGSTVTMEGPGDSPVTATLEGGGAIATSASDGRWRARFAMPARPTLLRLRDGAAERLVAIDGRADAVPTVTLSAPTRDSVLRTPNGRLALAADARDDIGLARAQFEVIVSSGEGESFTFRSTVLGAVRGNGRTQRLAAVLRLDSLELKAGDIVHLRAIARDANDVTGPGVGSSETRTLRVARAGEYDSVAVDPAPPGSEEKSALSQRMIIMMTEALEKRRPRLARPTLLAEASRISVEQTKLRRAVGDVIFMRLTGESPSEHAHGEEEADAKDPQAALLERAREAGAEPEALDFAEGESPVVAVNKPLLEAYNAMWDAGRELDQGATDRALPHMRRALAAIQKARQAERIYLRGKPPVAVIDLARVRLTGKEQGEPGARTPLPVVDPRAAARAARLARALSIAAARPRDAGAAVDSLLVLRVEAATEAPALAQALDALVEALRRGRDATDAALRARRAAAGSPAVADTLGAWGGGLP